MMPIANQNVGAAASRGLLASARHIASRIAARFTPVPITWLRPRPGGATNITALQVERETLIADLREARRNHRSTYEIRSRLNAITLQILKGTPDA